MKKLVLLLMCLALVMASPAVFAGNMEAVGGMTVNTFDVTMSLEGYDFTSEVKDVLNGNGMFVGGRFWFNDNLAVGAGYDYMAAKPSMRFEESPFYYEEGLDIVMQGLYAELVYKLTDYIKLKGALANYNMTAEPYEEENEPTPEASYEEVKGSGMGYIIGGEMSYPLKDNLSLNSTMGYRTASLTFDDDVPFMFPVEEAPEQQMDVKGFFFSVGLNMAF